MATARSGPLTFLPIRTVAETCADPSWKACGTNGCIVSREGAERPLAQVMEDGFFGDVDWRMFAYSLGSRAVMGVPAQHFSRRALGSHLAVCKSRKPLTALAASIGLIDLVDTGSGRKQQNTGIHVHDDS